MKASLCPVCNGRGNLPPQMDFSSYYETPCHGCNGKGWVEVLENVDPLEVELNWRQRQSDSIDLTKCPACGGDRNSPALTGCPMGSHYGTYCQV